MEDKLLFSYRVIEDNNARHTAKHQEQAKVVFCCVLLRLDDEGL